MEENDYKTIDQELQGELADDQQAAFDERLISDEEFAAAYKMSQQMTNYLQAKLKQPALEAKMTDLGRKYFKTAPPAKAKLIKMPFLRRALAVAAALALLMVVWNPFDSGDLYTQFAHHPSLALVEKSVANDFMQEAEIAYASQQYETAFLALSKVVKAQPTNFQAKLALGISALESDRIEEAQAIFVELSNDTSLLKTYGQWYLALSYVKEGENEKAKSILKNLGNDEPLLKKKAEELLLNL